MSYFKMSTGRALWIVWLGIWGVLFSANAQDKPVPESSNLIKLNGLPLVTGRVVLEYERMISNRLSLGTAVGLGPSRPLPFRSFISNYADEPILVDMINGFRSSSFSFTPELRFYTSRRGLFRGFYVAPYIQYATFGVSAPFHISVSEDFMGQTVYQREEDIRLTGRLNTFTAGVSIGASFKLAEQWYLDWRIIGPGYGTGRSSISGAVSLDANEQEYVREELLRLRDDLQDLPFPIRIEPSVDSEGVDIRMQRSPWANLRAGLSIGYRF